jgi:hypothetical protein
MRRTDSWVNHIWQILANPGAAALALGIAGVFLVAVPFLSFSPAEVANWWEASRYFSLTPAVPAGLLTVTVFSLAIRESTSEALLSEQSFQHYGHILAILGVVVGLGGWFFAQKESQTGRTAVTPGEPVRTYTSFLDETAIDINIPGRMTLLSVEDSEAEIRFESRTGSSTASRIFKVGDRMEWEGRTVTMTGFSKSETFMRAVFSIDNKNVQSLTAAVGTGLQIPGRSASFDVKDAVSNYMDMLGPAVHLNSEEHGDFWLFAKEKKLDAELHGDLPIQLERLERMQAPMFSVSGVRPVWPTQVGLGALLVGLLLFLWSGLPCNIRRQPATWTAVIVGLLGFAGAVTQGGIGPAAAGAGAGILFLIPGSARRSDWLWRGIFALPLGFVGYLGLSTSAEASLELTLWYSALFALLAVASAGLWRAGCSESGKMAWFDVGVVALWLAVMAGWFINWIHRGHIGAATSASWLTVGTLLLVTAANIGARYVERWRMPLVATAGLILVSLYAGCWYINTVPGLSIIF